MNNILSEKEYQKFIMERLEQDNGYVIRKATSYDRLFSIDRELLFKFLNDTQGATMAALRITSYNVCYTKLLRCHPQSKK